MTIPNTNPGQRQTWVRSAAMAIVALAVAVSISGCCTVTPTMAFGCTKECNQNVLCACAVPEAVTVKKGKKIRFVNASRIDLVIKVPEDHFKTLDGSDVTEIPLPVKGDELLKLRRGVPAGAKVELEVVVASSAPSGADWCPGEPGPRIDVDK